MMEQDEAQDPPDVGPLRPLAIVADSNGGEGEFYVRGRAALTSDPRLREEAVRAASYAPQDDYILFVLSIEFAFLNRYLDGKANPRRWQA